MYLIPAKNYHNSFKLKLEAFSGKVSCDIEVLYKPKIFRKIALFQKVLSNKEFQEKKLWPMDYGKGCSDIELLLVAGFFCQVFI